jgi:hypothetical protein
MNKRFVSLLTPPFQSFPTVMSRLYILFLCFFALVSLSSASEPITVKKVDFTLLRDKWTQVEVELKCGENKSPAARNKDFVENVKAKVYLAYQLDGKTPSGAPKFDYYTAEVEIIMMERGDDYNLYFYLPGMIYERDRFSQVDPAYYYVEISIAGEVLAPQKGAVSDLFITTPSSLPNFVSKADSEGAENDHILMPVYHTPVEYRGKVSDLPIFLRRDVRQ